MRITSELAHPIILKLKMLLNYNINIMDNDGIIVSSTDTNRLYQIHQGALQVIETKKPLLIYPNEEARFHGTKPGVNLPVEQQNKVVGVIGITGDPNEVLKFAQILKVTVEVMLQEMELFNKLHYENKIVENWVLDLVHSYNLDYDRLEADGIHYLNLNLDQELSVFLIRFNDFPKKGENDLINIRKKKDERLNQIRSFIPKISFSAFLDEGCCLIALPHMKDKKYLSVARSIKGFFTSHGLSIHITIGNAYKGVMGYRKSYLEAHESLLLMDKFPCEENIVHTSEWGYIQLFQQIPKEKLRSFYSNYLPAKIKLTEEQFHTLRVLFESELNMKVTAQTLHVHRNTLLYRLDNIAKQTGLDPKSFQDAMTLNLLMVIGRLIV